MNNERKKELKSIIINDITDEDKNSMSLSDLWRKYAVSFSYSTFIKYWKTFRIE